MHNKIRKRTYDTKQTKADTEVKEKLPWNLMLLKIFRLILCVFSVVMIGSIGAFFTTPVISTWYKTLNKPAFNPPNALFGPAWTILFILIGISLFFILESGLKNKKMPGKAILIFTIQMILNVFWSISFFGLKSPLLGFIDILLLDAAVIYMIIEYYKIRKEAAYLLIPYALWILFATILNFSILILN